MPTIHNIYFLFYASSFFAIILEQQHTDFKPLMHDGIKIAATNALLASNFNSFAIKDEEMSRRFLPAKNMSDKAHDGLHRL